MYVFGSKGDLSRIMILKELATADPSSLRGIAEPLGMTPQGAWDHLRTMEKEGLVKSDGRRYAATVKGIELLHRTLLEMKGFIDDAVSRLEIISSTDAVAHSSIKEGDAVHLFMREGLLFAGPGFGEGASGVSDTDAEPLEMVSISKLRGVVEIDESLLLFCDIRPLRSGGGRDRQTRERLNDVFSRSFGRGSTASPVISALDLESVALLRRSDVEGVLEFPNTRMLVDTVSRGLSVIAVGTPHTVSKRILEIEEGVKSVIWKRTSL